MNYDYDKLLSGLFGGAMILTIFLGILILAILVLGIISLWKVFKKAGKKGWESIVPIYSFYVLVEIAELHWWWFLLAISDSIVNLVELDNLSLLANLASLLATFNIYYNIAKKFGKEKGAAICAGIFNLIFMAIFGLSKNEVYNANIPVSKNGIFDTPEGNFNQQYNNQSQQNMNNTIRMNNVNNVHVEPETSYCGNCGAKINKSIRFCPNCGKENL